MRDRDYWWWFIGDTLWAASRGIASLALPLLAFTLSGSPLAAGTVVTVRLVIEVLLTLPGGIVVDRYDRRLLMWVGALVGAIVWGVVSAGVIGGWLLIGSLVALAGVDGVNAGLLGGATDAALRSLVAGEEYALARARNQGRDAAIQLVTGPLGGLLFAIAHVIPFALVSLLSLLAAVSALMIRKDLRPHGNGGGLVWEEWTEAVSWLRHRRRVGRILVITAAVNVGIIGISYAWQLAMLSAGESTSVIGLIDGAVALSVLIGAVLAGRLVPRFPTGSLLVFGLVWLALCVSLSLVFGYGVPIIAASALSAFLLVPSANAGIAGYLFAKIPVFLQGRVQAQMKFIVHISGGMAPFVVGLVYQRTGYAWTIAGSLAFIVSVTAFSAMSLRIREIPRPAEWANCAP